MSDRAPAPGDGADEELRRIEGVRLLQFSQNRGSGSVRKASTTLPADGWWCGATPT